MRQTDQFGNNNLTNDNNKVVGEEIFSGENLALGICDSEFGDELLASDVDILVALRETEQIHLVEQ